MQKQETFILSFDPASTNPSISICTSNDFGTNSRVCTRSLLSPSTNSTNSTKYDSALFLNLISELCTSVNCEPVQISTVAFCAGPGSFSPIRVGAISMRILYRLNPQIKVYKFNLLYLLAKKYKLQKLVPDNTNIFYLKAGTKGYFKEIYGDDIKEKIHLVKEIEENGFVIDEQMLKTQNFNLSEFMIEVLNSSNSEKFLVKNLSEIAPDYLREASVTLKKQ